MTNLKIKNKVGRNFCDIIKCKKQFKFIKLLPFSLIIIINFSWDNKYEDKVKKDNYS